MTPQGILVGSQYLLDAGPSSRGWHHAATVLTCPQLWAYGHHPAMQGDPRVYEKRSPPLVRGGLVHVGLGHYYRRLQAVQQGEDPDAYYAPVEAMRIYSVREDEGLLPGEARCADYLDEAIRAVCAYADHWADYDFPKVLAVEQEYTVTLPTGGLSLEPLVTQWTISQRIDLVMQGKDSKVHVIDNKTAGRREEKADRAYTRSGQFQLMRVFGEALWGERFAGTWINYLVFGAKGPSFDRVPARKKPWRLKCFLRTIQWAERTIQDCLRLGFDPWEYPKVCLDNGACEHRYNECPFAHLCDYGPPFKA